MGCSTAAPTAAPAPRAAYAAIESPVTKIDRYRQTRGNQLDSLLRKIQRQGLSSLTDKEMRWLKRVSGELRRELEVETKSGGGRPNA